MDRYAGADLAAAADDTALDVCPIADRGTGADDAVARQDGGARERDASFLIKAVRAAPVRALGQQVGVGHQWVGPALNDVARNDVVRVRIARARRTRWW